MSQEINFNLRPVKFNPTIDGSSDTTYVLRVEDASGTVCDLSGYTARMQVRPFLGSSTVYDTLTTENGRLSISNGEVAVTFPSSVTKDYSFVRAVYDIVIILGQKQWRIAEGKIEFTKEVTL